MFLTDVRFIFIEHQFIFVTEKRNKNRVRREETKTPLESVAKEVIPKMTTWADGFYIIEIEKPIIDGIDRKSLDVDVVVEMKNSRGGYITADEYPALVFYSVMCGIYAFFAVLWLVWCAFYWRELLKIQFWIGGVILIGMIEKSAFVAEYDTVNRHGFVFIENIQMKINERRKLFP